MPKYLGTQERIRATSSSDTADDVLADRGMGLTELSERVGITMANIPILKTGKAKAGRFTTLEAICTALDCQPGDLLSVEEPLQPR